MSPPQRSPLTAQEVDAAISLLERVAVLSTEEMSRIQAVLRRFGYA